MPGKFIDRYVFPDGELTGSGRIITKAQNAGFEVRHEENLREHYALTLKGWCANLVANWDFCVAEAGVGRARVWGLYMAGSRLGFETNEVQLHQVLGGQAGRGRQLRLRAAPDLVSRLDRSRTVRTGRVSTDSGRRGYPHDQAVIHSVCPQLWAAPSRARGCVR